MARELQKVADVAGEDRLVFDNQDVCHGARFLSRRIARVAAIKVKSGNLSATHCNARRTGRASLPAAVWSRQLVLTIHRKAYALTGQTSHDNRPEQVRRASGPRRAIWWRWYHFYFLLAIFDLVVIIASLALYHESLNSYDEAIGKLSRIHAGQRCVANLRIAVIDVNIPGNDVFESLQVEEERARFEEAEEELSELSARADTFDVDLTEAREHIRAMVRHERDVFDTLANGRRRKQTVGPVSTAGPVAPAVGGGDGQEDDKSARTRLERATVQMAAMDRRKAAALTSLTELEQMFLTRADSLLDEYRLLLIARTSFEKYFLATVVLILIGVFWYGRKLQHMHDRMLADQQQAAVARHQRLAAVGELCTAVAHGIRNPLAAISSSAQLGISAGTMDEDTKRRVGDILTECHRLDQRVTRLLDFASGTKYLVEDYCSFS